jgi:hypothetical protein
MAVMQAFLDGKTIQRRRNTADAWLTDISGVWDFVMYEYRVKPEPREFWVNWYTGGGKSVHLSREAAKDAEDPYQVLAERIHVREVIDTGF